MKTNAIVTIARKLKGLALVTLCVFRRFFDDGCTYRAASLAYGTLLSIVPLMIVGFTILSFVPEFQGVAKQVQDIVLQNFVAASASIIDKYLNDFSSHVTQLSIGNIVFLAIVVIFMMYNINRAFRAIWHAEHRFHFSLSFLIYLVVLVISPILLGVMTVLGTLLIKLSYVTQLMEMTYIKQTLFLVLPYMLTFITFTVFNWVLPSCKVKLRFAAVGGLFTTILFEIAKHFFAVYLVYFPTYRLLYGALATIPIFLVWLYVSWTIILLGAVVTNVVARGVPERYRVKNE